MSKKSSNYGNDALAFLIVECNVPLPYDIAVNLTTRDPLYISLANMWEIKREREDYRTALLCMIINNSAGGKSKIEDFMPKKVLSVAEREAKIRQNIALYNSQMNKGGDKR